MNSTSFGPIVSPIGVRKAKGGHVEHEEPKRGALNLVVVMPHPAIPALAHAAMLHHAGLLLHHHLRHAILRHRGGR